MNMMRRHLTLSSYQPEDNEIFAFDFNMQFILALRLHYISARA